MNEKNESTADRHQLVVSRELSAAPELVWKAWTDPVQMIAWLSLGEDFTIESVRVELHEGGKFRIQTKRPDGEYFTAAGTYLEVKAPERLVYTWDWEKDGAGAEFGELEGQETQITVELSGAGEKTKLTLTQENLLSPEKRDRHIEGWTNWLGRLAKFLET